MQIYALLIAIALDWFLGDPAWIPHPVIYFGKGISFFEKNLNNGEKRVMKGALSSLFLIGFTFLVFWMFMAIVEMIMPNVGIAVEAVFIFLGLAGTTLIKEGRDVFAALDRSLDEGRKQVGRIVGRDTSELSAHEVRKATLETLAENLSDGVIAPLFWYAIAGVPGMMTYKMINTLDSMIGYKSDRYLEYGRWAAIIDDIANWIPARITALLMCIVSMKPRSFKFVSKYRNAHSSPNAGYPESALAGILDLRFGGPSNYFGKVVDKPYIGTNPRDITNNDIQQTIVINRTTEVVMVLLILLIG